MLCTKCKKRDQKWIGKWAFELLGWRKMESGWWCPFCTGILEPLKRVFRRRR
jgi:hypothetical protein